ncbi:hypothetical protein MWN33_06360 [Starkeya koreensis]|uniref:Sulfotransferase family protein n=1 Tax=Ancylobacter koreensis TaxID=266121 RepID=A0ABT0DKD4_9HYPH|nr:hypothetical protein [Ancylobacter koreensis]MCK0207654.1 hypothetical protein [Ancylobacter koreensis]
MSLFGKGWPLFKNRGPRHHVLITGTGRAGTSFLMQLLTRLDFDTGFSKKVPDLNPIARAGFETDPRRPDAPYVVKSPWICDYIEEVLANPAIRIDHVFVPVRNFEAAAASRAHVQKENTGQEDGGIAVPGGLWDTTRAADQTQVLRERFTRLVEHLVRADIETTFLWYPRLTQDPAYLHAKLGRGLKMPELDSFTRTFEEIVRPDWVHSFTPDDRNAEG